MKIKYSENSVIIENMQDFNPIETLDCGQAFRWRESENKSVIGIAHGKICTVSMENTNLVLGGVNKQDFENIWLEYFDLSRDYKSIKELCMQNEVLAKAVEFAPGIRVLKQDKWEALCSFIISQNNNIKRIKGIIERLCEAYGEEITAGYYTFPSASVLCRLTPEDLAPLRCGFRARYIIDAAKKVASGEINLEEVAQMPIEEARKELMKIVGVGVKVADCSLLFGFGRIDCFPVDVWIKRAMQALLPEGLPENLLPYAGIVQQYIFHYARVCPEAFSDV